MAVRRGSKPAAPVKVRLRKNHGPKRHLWHGLDKVGRIDMGACGCLNKYWDKESFALACNARGVKMCINELWDEYKLLPTCAAKNAYLAVLKDNLKRILDDKNKKSLTKKKK